MPPANGNTEDINRGRGIWGIYLRGICSLQRRLGCGRSAVWCSGTGILSAVCSNMNCTQARARTTNRSNSRKIITNFGLHSASCFTAIKDIVDISDPGVFGVFGVKFGPKNVRNLHLFTFLRAFWSLLRVFARFLSVKNCGN